MKACQRNMVSMDLAQRFFPFASLSACQHQIRVAIRFCSFQHYLSGKGKPLSYYVYQQSSGRFNEMLRCTNQPAPTSAYWKSSLYCNNESLVDRWLPDFSSALTYTNCRWCSHFLVVRAICRSFGWVERARTPARVVSRPWSQEWLKGNHSCVRKRRPSLDYERISTVATKAKGNNDWREIEFLKSHRWHVCLIRCQRFRTF